MADTKSQDQGSNAIAEIRKDSDMNKGRRVLAPNVLTTGIKANIGNALTTGVAPNSGNILTTGWKGCGRLKVNSSKGVRRREDTSGEKKYVNQETQTDEIVVEKAASEENIDPETDD